MRTKAPALLPIFRSQHQADLLTLLLLHPDRDYTPTELAALLGTPLTTLQRDLDQLTAASILTQRRIGRFRLLRANQESRYLRPLTELVTLAFGPQVVVAEEFSDVDGVEAAAVYGSWAARYHGRLGPPPNDVDVLVIGRPERDSVYAAADRVEQRLSLPVNPTILSPDRWHTGDDTFVRQLRTDPLVWSVGTDPTEAP